jgi:hypothetical protein
MPTPTYTALANITLSAAATGISFASIPSTYRDLIVVVQAKGTSDGQLLRVTFNSNSATIYNRQRMSSNGSTASAAEVEDSAQFIFSATSATAIGDSAQQIINVLDYSLSNKNKTVLARSDNGNAGTDAFSGEWKNTAAVTSIEVYSNQNLDSGSTFALYGIVA